MEGRLTRSHAVTYRHEKSDRPGSLVHGGVRAICTCGWASDCYAQVGDTDRAAEVHQRREQAADFDGLIARSSIGMGLADIKARGIEAHLVDLEREMMPAWQRAKLKNR